MNGGADDNAPVRGRIDRGGRLIGADPLLAALHRRAGGAAGGTVAVPQIAAVARLARRLNVVVSRGVVAADGLDDLDLWVRAQPDGDAIDLAIVGWRRRPATPPFPAAPPGRTHDFLRAGADWTWETDAALNLRALDPTSADRIGDVAQGFAGQPLTRIFTLIESEDGTLPILLGLAQQAMFRDQAAELKARPGALLTLSGMPLVGGDGRFAGFRGTATAVPDPADEEAERARQAQQRAGEERAERERQEQGAAFARRLDVALRLPLDRIISRAESIRSQSDGPLRRDYADYAEDIATAGRHLLALVDDLVDLQTIERPDFTPMRDPVDMADVARRAAGLLSVRAADRDITIDRPAPTEALPALAEFRRALQIAVNLIGNAVRYSPDGGTVAVRCERDGSRVALIVADQGKGIDSADQARIFEKFERVDPAEPGGTGLGLYIARRLAQAMGGDLVVESAAGKGARFILTLPAIHG
ncbi:MAG: histidine kinase [Sphingomonas bacterium]|nr:HAMP domain-containing sensor histidine kinase [Sphingomonas bacterium]MDB5688351.1 histidine kinase [Sphingomonas bacterium]